MKSSQITELLRQIRPFDHLSDSQLTQLAGCTTYRRYPGESLLVRHGETTSEIYALLEGGLEVRRQTPFGRFLLARLIPGELAGELCFLDGSPRSGDVATMGDSAVLVLNPEALSDLSDKDLRFSLGLHWAFWRSVAQKLREANDLLADFGSSDDPVAPASAAPEAAAGEDFRVGLEAKRSLFEEQRLSNLEINFLASLSREERYAEGQVLFREGEPGDKLYVVLEGQVRIGKFLPGGGEEALTILGRGEYFGEMALVDQQPRSADARAHEGPVVVLAISADVLSGILDIQKMSSLRLLKILCGLATKRLRDLDEKLVGWFILSEGALNPPELG